jgi:hypothetical protein
MLDILALLIGALIFDGAHGAEGCFLGAPHPSPGQRGSVLTAAPGARGGTPGFP